MGDIMMDRYIWGEATRISPEAPVPVVRVSRETATAGAAANVALNLQSLGADVVLCGWTGAGGPGKQLRSLLADKGITIIPDSDDSHCTIVKTRIMAGSQQLCRCDNEAAPPQDVLSFAADLLGVALPPEEDYASADMSPMARSFYAESKKVRNDRIKTELGVGLIYPTYREGLRALLAEENARSKV